MKKITLVAFSLALLFASCKKDSSNSAAPPSNNGTTLTANSTPQVSFKLDGVAVSALSGASISQDVGSSKNIATPPDSSSGSWSGYFTTVSTGDEIFGVDKGFLKFLGSDADSASFSNLFKVGASSYVANPDNQFGVRIAYFINGVQWSTDLGAGTQTGSAFTITDRKWWTVGSSSGVNVLASFNCKLYDGAGNSKTVTNGVVVCGFENY